MIKETVTYEDFDGNLVTEDLYFNFTKTDLIKWGLSDEGIRERLAEIVSAKDNKQIFSAFEDIVLKAYGIKDGDKHRKSEEISKDFKDSLAFDAFMSKMLFSEDQTIAEKFINGVIPKIDKGVIPKVD